MKNWKVVPASMREKPVNVLAHRCQGDQYQWAHTDNEPRHWCSMDKDGWFCGLCQERPPQAMVDVADLTQCCPLHIYDENGRMKAGLDRW